MVNDEKDYRDKVEAILFTTGRFVSAVEVARLCGFKNVGYIQEILRELRREYELKGGALELVEIDGKWKLNAKPRFGYITNQLVADSEFDKSTQKTLAVIAFKEPVLQAEIIKVRGNKAYEHIGSLGEKGLITSEKHGRTRMLKLATKFYEYFDVDKETINKLKKVEDGIKRVLDKDNGEAIKEKIDK